MVRLAVLVGALGCLAYARHWAFVIVMGLVVFIFMHELGHYLVAKRAGMKVTEFFIGFGPRIWSFRRGETEYGIKLIWLGAYVKIIGMSNLEEVAPEDEARTYRAKSFGKRMPVVLAGPAMNLAIGFVLLFVVVAGFGKPSDTKFDVSSVIGRFRGRGRRAPAGRPHHRLRRPAIDDFDSLKDLVQERAGTTSSSPSCAVADELVLPVAIGWSLTDTSAARARAAGGRRRHPGR